MIAAEFDALELADPELALHLWPVGIVRAIDVIGDVGLQQRAVDLNTRWRADDQPVW